MTLLISSFICVLANYSFVTIGVLLPLQLRTLVHTITECLPSSTLDTPTCKQVYELLKKQVERGRSAALSTQRWLALFTSVPETTTTFELTTDYLRHGMIAMFAIVLLLSCCFWTVFFLMPIPHPLHVSLPFFVVYSSVGILF
jgi:hypothetical protein